MCPEFTHPASRYILEILALYSPLKNTASMFILGCCKLHQPHSLSILRCYSLDQTHPLSTLRYCRLHQTHNRFLEWSYDTALAHNGSWVGMQPNQGNTKEGPTEETVCGSICKTLKSYASHRSLRVSERRRQGHRRNKQRNHRGGFLIVEATFFFWNFPSE